MKLLKIGVVAAIATAGAIGFATPASAVCDPVLSAVLGRCANSCSVVGIAYGQVQEHVDGLPSIECAA